MCVGPTAADGGLGRCVSGWRATVVIGQKHAEHAPPREGFREVGQKQKHHFVVPEAVQDVPRQPLALDPPLAVPAVRCGPRLVPPGVLVVGGPEAPKPKFGHNTGQAPIWSAKNAGQGTPISANHRASNRHSTQSRYRHSTQSQHSHSTVTAQLPSQHSHSTVTAAVQCGCRGGARTLVPSVKQ